MLCFCGLRSFNPALTVLYYYYKCEMITFSIFHLGILMKEPHKFEAGSGVVGAESYAKNSYLQQDPSCTRLEHCLKFPSWY